MSHPACHLFTVTDHVPLPQHHSFPYDFRAGPSPLDWDPSKWVLLVLHQLGFVTGLRRARLDEIEDAKLFMRSKSHVTHHDGSSENTGEGEAAWSGPVWDMDQVMEYAENMGTKTAPCLMVVDGFVIDATSYMKEHVGSFPFHYVPSDRLDIS